MGGRANTNYNFVPPTAENNDNLFYRPNFIPHVSTPFGVGV